MNSETSSEDLFFDIFSKVKSELETVTEFKCLINNPFDMETYLPQPVVLKCQQINLKLDKIASYQTTNIVIYCGLVVRQDNRKQVLFLYVNKKTGDYQPNETFIIDDQVTAQALGLIWHQNKPSISYIIGTQTGFVKVLSIANRSTITKMKIHTIPIISIETAKQNNQFDYRSIALVLCQDQSIFLTNLDKMQVLVQYKCGTIPSKTPLKVLFHSSYKYFLQASDDGSLHFWQITSQAIEKINYCNQNPKIKNDFKKSFSIIPSYETNPSPVFGIVDFTFFGNFVLFLTQNGTLKMIALDKSVQKTYLTIFNQIILDCQTSKEKLTAQKVVIVPDICSIFVLSKTKLFQLIYNQYSIIKKKILTVETLVSLEDFSISSDYLLMISGKNFRRQKQIFFQKLNPLTNESLNNVAPRERKQRSYSNKNNLLIN